MAFSTRSKVMAFVEETTEGVLVDPTAADFAAVREGAALTGAVATEASDEIRNSIGASKSFVTKEEPTGNIPRYLKTSGVEGQAPEDAVLVKSCLGGLEVYGTEEQTIAGSTAGDANTRAQVAVADGRIAAGNLKVGQAMLVKDGTNGYAVRNIVALDDSGDPDLLTSSFNFSSAPGAGVGLGKAIYFETKDDSQPTFSAHEYQSSTTASGYHLAEAGVRTTTMTLEFPANGLATVTYELGGIAFFQNPVRITATNKYVDFTDSSSTVAAIISEGVYKTPRHLANEIAAKMTAASVDTISVVFSSKTGNFTISTDGDPLSLLWQSGTNAANAIATTIGFDNAADDTGALSYTSDNAQTYGPGVTPAFDDSSPKVVRNNMMLLGTFNDYECFSGQSLTVTITTPKADVPDWCSESGTSESIVTSREVAISGTIKFKKHDIDRIYGLLENETIQMAFVNGNKSGGNWVPGTISSVFVPELSMDSDQVAEADGYITEEFSGNAIVGTVLNDIYYNQL